MAAKSEAVVGRLKTTILPVRSSAVNMTPNDPMQTTIAEDWSLRFAPESSEDARVLTRAAQELRETDIPVAFPTETVYGLGADATRSSAVQGIFRAKQRPSDNPLIVHVHSLRQLRTLLQPPKQASAPGSMRNRDVAERSPERSSTRATKCSGAENEGIPAIYMPLIQRFWPGPLTLIVPNPVSMVFAPEVTAGLPTVGVRMPQSPVALALIKLSGVPLAAPSANASTKPSPTTAEHVKHDLDGRIATILDGGPCNVGVESTVVDGLSKPPLILRPGGISIEDLRKCPGWEDVAVGYVDASSPDTKPRAPGMKYKHYSPRAAVILHEYNSAAPSAADIKQYLDMGKGIGVIRTALWQPAWGHQIVQQSQVSSPSRQEDRGDESKILDTPFVSTESRQEVAVASALQCKLEAPSASFLLWDIALKGGAEKVAQGIFSALRELDQRAVDVIFVEGIDDGKGDVATAVMNRLRKAAETRS